MRNCDQDVVNKEKKCKNQAVLGPSNLQNLRKSYKKLMQSRYFYQAPKCNIWSPYIINCGQEVANKVKMPKSGNFWPQDFTKF